MPIRESVPHIYVSALLFTHPNNLIRQSSNYLTAVTLNQPRPTSASFTFSENPRGLHSREKLLAYSPGVADLQPAHSISFSPDGKQIFSAGDHKAVHVWDVVTCERKMKLLPKDWMPRSNFAQVQVQVVAISPDSGYVAAGYYNSHNSIRMWNASDGKELQVRYMNLVKNEQKKGRGVDVGSLVFSPDGNSLASGTLDGHIFIWDLSIESLAQKRIIVHEPDSHREPWILALSYSRDSSTLASACDLGSFVIWNMRTNPPTPSHYIDSGHIFKQGWRAVAFWPYSNADNFTAAIGMKEGQIVLQRSIWDETTQFKLPYTGEPVKSLAFSSDGRCLVTGSRDHNVIVWNVATGSAIGPPLKGHSNWVSSVAFSPDGKQIALGSWDKLICIWDWETIEANLDQSQVLFLSSICFVYVLKKSVTKVSPGQADSLFLLSKISCTS